MFGLLIVVCVTSQRCGTVVADDPATGIKDGWTPRPRVVVPTGAVVLFTSANIHRHVGQRRWSVRTGG